MIEYQQTSLEVWNAKYRLADNDGNPVDTDIRAMNARVAKTLARVETENTEKWEKEFLWALEHGAIPAGRILSNAGAREYKPATSLINCTVADTIPDSMVGILSANLAAGLTLKAGAGVGYDFSTLRPKGALVRGAGASTSGPLPFMDIFDKTCETISSAGNRRGAQMGCMDISHPDVIAFITAKRQDGRLRKFNLSVLITREFIDAVKNDAPWDMIFPALAEEVDNPDIKIVYRAWPTTEGYTTNGDGLVAMRVYETIRAAKLWNLIMTSTYDYAEPGFILIDEVNEMNNNWFCETIRATNPCGEQPLPPNGACLLGSVNLVEFIRNPFTENASFDWEQFRGVVGVFTRMLDNVVELNGLPLAAQRREILSKRRHGMGYMGLGSALNMLRLSYGCEASLTFTERVTLEMALAGWEAASRLAVEKGMAPALSEEYAVTPRMMAMRPEMARDGIRLGDQVPGRILHARYSRYMQRLANVAPALVADLEKTGARFTHHTSLAPTGTIALSVGNNVSNGIEPTFAHHYLRNIVREGKKTKEQIEVYSYEFLAYRKLVDPEAKPETLPPYFSTSNVPPESHLDVQAAAQRWVGSAISKTINVPPDIPFDTFKNLYLRAAEKRLKGCTTFRFNPEVHQGVLVKKDDLINTVYRFTLEDGSVVEARGNEKIAYDGEIHTAANLFDAWKEGRYGKY